LSAEQLRGAGVDGRSGVYSLGIVLYEMLAGNVPFADLDSLDTLRAHLENPPPPLPPTLPASVRAIVDRALRKRPEDRFASAAALVAAIDEALPTLPTEDSSV